MAPVILRIRKFRDFVGVIDNLFVENHPVGVHQLGLQRPIHNGHFSKIFVKRRKSRNLILTWNTQEVLDNAAKDQREISYRALICLVEAAERIVLFNYFTEFG